MNWAAVEEQILGGTTTRRAGAVFVRGEGCWLIDCEGRRYLDVSAAQGVAMLGHCHPRVSEAVGRQARSLMLCPSFPYNDVRAEFARALTEAGLDLVEDEERRDGRRHPRAGAGSRCAPRRAQRRARCANAAVAGERARC